MSELNLEKSKKLLAIALDLSGQPEGDVAASMFVKELKRSGVTLDNLIGGTIPQQEPKKPAAKTDGLSEEFLHKVKFPFGKHKGERMWDVALENRSYLEWVAENITFREAKLNAAVEQILETAPVDDENGDINLD